MKNKPLNRAAIQKNLKRLATIIGRRIQCAGLDIPMIDHLIKGSK